MTLQNLAKVVVRQMLRLVILFMNILVKPNKNIIVFNSLYGTQIGDSPKVIYDRLKCEDPYINLYWIINPNVDVLDIPSNHCIKTNSMRHIYILLRASVWISNSKVESIHGVNVPKGNRLYINTWHGVPFKLLGEDESLISRIDRKWYKTVKFDFLCACSNYDLEIFKKIFPNSRNKIYKTGIPRDIELSDSNTIDVRDMKERLGIPTDKIVILYAPTFRDRNFYSGKMQKQFLSLAESSSREANETRYFILNRSHYNAAREKKVSLGEDGFSIDATAYNDLNMLMLVSDVLITDYSSIVFDYSLLKKPILLYQYDLEEYVDSRGMYKNPKDLGFPSYVSPDGLLSALDDNEILKKSIDTADKVARWYFPRKNVSLERIVEVVENR